MNFKPIKYNKDLTFHTSDQIEQSVTPTRLVLVFVTSFVIIFTILNYPTIYSRAQSYFGPGPDQQAINLELENFYKAKYGSGNYLLPMPSSNLTAQAGEIQLSVVEEGLDTIGRATSFPSTSNSVSTSTATEDEGNFISITKLNIKAPIIVVPKDDKLILANLKSGVVLYPGSALPGQPGTTVIIGHSSSNFPHTKYSTIFAGLNKLTAGDAIHVNFWARSYTYIVKGKKIGSSAELAKDFPSDDLVIGTCWPVGTDKNRIIVLANLE